MDIVKNKVQLTGRIGKFCQFREFANGRKKGALSLCTTEIYYKGDVKNVKYDWHNLIVWGKLAEEMEKSCQPGIVIAVAGKLVSRNYTDASGKRHFITEIEVKEFEIVNRQESILS